MAKTIQMEAQKICEEGKMDMVVDVSLKSITLDLVTGEPLGHVLYHIEVRGIRVGVMSAPENTKVSWVPLIMPKLSVLYAGGGVTSFSKSL